MKYLIAVIGIALATSLLPMASAQTLELPTGTIIAEDQTPDPKPLVITKVDVQKRLEELKSAQAQMAANLQAIGGAIQQCEWFISELDNRAKALKEKEDKEKTNGQEPKKPN
jgi:peptidoglycan hydrolase CwlO-like protein